ncbi:MAG: TylF/MycF/NovP-related O-methyltransferase [Acidimicrobiia bacterium]
MTANLRRNAPADDASRLRDLYLTILKRAVMHTLYTPLDSRSINDYLDPEDVRQSVLGQIARGELDLNDQESLRRQREMGRDWPQFGQTMVGLDRLDNIQQCYERILDDGIAGDLIEAGVWRGGVAIFMRGLLEAYGDRDRVVYAADSFQGLPSPNADEYPADEGDRFHTLDALAVSRDEVANNFSLYGLLDERVQFLEGWFKDTLPTVHDRTWSIIRLDGDMYESTMDVLTHLYPQLSVGGFLIVDDFALAPCKQAIEDFRAAHGIAEPIEEVDWTGVFWRRTR